MRDAGWRLLLTPDIDTDGGFGYALDNGAYGCWLRDESFNEVGFMQLLKAKGHGSDWVVVPDIVAAGDKSLDFSLSWLPVCQQYASLCLLAVQDGMTPDMLVEYLDPGVGLFIGGTTEWKLKTMPEWGALAAFCGSYLHVGRVNSRRRIRYCAGIGAHSFDGTSVSKYAVNLPMLDAERLQGHLPW